MARKAKANRHVETGRYDVAALDWSRFTADPIKYLGGDMAGMFICKAHSEDGAAWCYVLCYGTGDGEAIEFGELGVYGLSV